ncbi:MAG: DEAD/DEAH box helicase [Candidatus Bathyarchaeota archaeon]
MQEPYKKFLEHPLIWPNTVEFRLYQKTIADAASERNSVVILSTALGKTVISAIVTANLLYNYRDIKILVMAPTRPLVVQHKSSFIKMLKIKESDVALLMGETPPDYRRVVWESKARIIFSTPQVVRNDLREHRFSLENYGLLIFDECHRAVKDYAYTAVARFYISQARYPRILGMTASPGSELSKVLEVCRNLYIEHVEYRGDEDPDVKPYIQPIDVEWLKVNLPKEYLEMKTQIKLMLDRRLKWLCNRGIVKSHPEYVTRRSVIEAGESLRIILEKSVEEEKGRIYSAIINQSLALTLFHMLELLETQGLFTLKAFVNKVEEEKKTKQSYSMLVNELEYKKLCGLMSTYSIEHPKIELLKKIVNEQLSSKPSSRMIIFAQYRDTTNNLVTQLNTLPKVRAERFVGQTSKPTDKGLSQEEQMKRIKELENGSLNVLVATSIAEEGLDIPSVDKVIFYEPIPSEIRHIQRRGRTGRKSPGKVSILATNDSLDSVYLYASWKRIEKMRKVAQNINTKLQPIIRINCKPSPSPLTPKEIQALEDATEQESEERPIIPKTQTLKEFRLNVERTSKNLYLKLLKIGDKEVSLGEIASDSEFESTPKPILRSTIEKLLKKGQIIEIDTDKYAISLPRKIIPGKTYEVTIEKILPGVAIVRVDERWNARLCPEEYNGPAILIKKNSRFRVIGELYKRDDVPHLRVKQVIGIGA